ncbi:MAG: metallophosphoesterase family protein [Gammaproteobacteria bacterium]
MAAAHAITVAILSDTHGQLDPRIAALVRGCDYAVHAGDIVGAGVLEQLQARRGMVAVRGNNDSEAKWPKPEWTTLRALPWSATLELPGGVLAVTHGNRITPVPRRHERLRRLFPEARVIVYGHSHVLTIDQAATPWILNPGAAGRARTHGGPSCLVLTASERDWRVETRRFEFEPATRRTAAKNPRQRAD